MTNRQAHQSKNLCLPVNLVNPINLLEFANCYLTWGCSLFTLERGISQKSSARRAQNAGGNPGSSHGDGDHFSVIGTSPLEQTKHWQAINRVISLHRNLQNAG